MGDFDELMWYDFPVDTDEDLFVTVLGAAEHGDVVSLKAIKEAEPIEFSNYLKTRGGRLMCEAVRWGQYKAADFLLCNGCSIKKRYPVKTTAFHLAAKDPCATDFLERLMIYHDSVPVDDHNNTPLHSACSAGVAKHVEILIQHGVKCDVTNSSLQTPLHLAALHGHTDCAKLLLQSGAQVNSRDSDGLMNSTPLDSVVQSLFALLGCHNLISYCVKAFLNWKPRRAGDIFAHLKSLDVFRELPSFNTNREALISRVNAFLQTIDVLIQNGANLNVLILIAKHLPPDIFSDIAREVIENHQVDVNTRDDLNYAPLHFVVSKCSCETLDYFIKCGADVNATSITGLTPLEVALERNAPVRIYELLLENGAKVNYMKESGWSPLMFALTSLEPPVVELLLKFGADPNAREPFEPGFTPLMRLVSQPPYHYLKAVKFLLKHGADVTMQDTGPSGFTALHWAAMCPNRGDVDGRKVVEMMLEHVNNVDLRDFSDFTPLLRAVTVQYASIPIIRLLLDAGADPHVCCDVEGGGPLEAAIRNSKNQIVDILMEYETALDPVALFHNRNILLTSIAINKPYNRSELFAARQFSIRDDIKMERMKCVKEFVRRKNYKWDQDSSNNLVFCLYEWLQGSTLERSCSSAWTSGCAVLFCEAENYVLGTKRIEVVDESLLRGVLEYRLEVSEGDSFKQACSREIETMKAFRVCDGLSVKDLLTNDVFKLTQLMRKSRVFLAISQNLDMFTDELEFPIYGDTIKRRVTDSVARRNLLQAASYFMNESLLGRGPSTDLFAWLPLDVVEYILSYLSKADLINWILFATETDRKFTNELREVWRIKLRKLLMDDCWMKHKVC